MWRDPDEEAREKSTPATKRDPTAALRSSIRRRPSVHGRRATLHLPPRLTRSPPPLTGANAQARASSRRFTLRNVPPVSTLLETADPVYASGSPRRSQDSDELQAARDLQRRITMRDFTRSVSRLEQSTEDLRMLSESLLRQRAAQIGSGRNVESRPAASDDSADHDNTPRPSYLVDDRGSLDPRHGRTAVRRANLPAPPEHQRERRRRPSNWGIGYSPLQRGQLDNILNGLGDRDRSPTPADGWEPLNNTITPDATLPSAESSFAIASASQSFASGGATITTEVLFPSRSFYEHTAEAAQYASPSPTDLDDVICDERDTQATAAFAEEMYYHELGYLEGRERISHVQELFETEGRVFALPDEPDRVEIGFRLIHAAFDTEDGRHRVRQLSQDLAFRGDIEHWVFSGRRPRRDELTQPDAELTASPRAASPTTETLVPDLLADFPRSSLSQSDIYDLDTETLRRIVERMAERDDVPDDWWMGFGLNLSRTRARSIGGDGDSRSRVDDSLANEAVSTAVETTAASDREISRL